MPGLLFMVVHNRRQSIMKSIFFWQQKRRKSTYSTTYNSSLWDRPTPYRNDPASNQVWVAPVDTCRTARRWRLFRVKRKKWTEWNQIQQTHWQRISVSSGWKCWCWVRWGRGRRRLWGSCSAGGGKVSLWGLGMCSCTVVCAWSSLFGIFISRFVASMARLLKFKTDSRSSQMTHYSFGS